MRVLSAFVAIAALFGGVQLFHDGNGESLANEATSSNTYRLVANGDEAACAVSRGPKFRMACPCLPSLRHAVVCCLA